MSTYRDLPSSGPTPTPVQAGDRVAIAGHIRMMQQASDTSVADALAACLVSAGSLSPGSEGS
ncbi:hypothetical protein HaLaN_19338 [Haematococcus lacustris]|uniref:Uncharacterized protein n=1 Tax=Haematococcus lacustris TaxID=44745 RepID=A0A699ZUH2_HAELA|nr:hypothetical protein HaLaN_19338 [Haematococcus lacustris]